MPISRFYLTLFILLFGCQASDYKTQSSNKVVDIEHTPIERQSIGNCWVYAEASWIESMHKSATGEDFDFSESYLTYWHWLRQIRSNSTEISPGGSFSSAAYLIRRYGLMAEESFVSTDSLMEMSYRQSYALNYLNSSLESGVLSTESARRNPKIVADEFDKAWGLSQEMRQHLDHVFGENRKRDFVRGDAKNEGALIIKAQDFKVQYASRDPELDKVEIANHTLSEAFGSWREENVWRQDRNQEIRIQKALHARQPVLISWAVDFNALDNSPQSLTRGSFHADVLAAAGEPGRQGFHLTALEDYEIQTEEFGVLPAGVTLNSSIPDDGKKLSAALLPSSRLIKLRIKNSWGANRPDRVFVEGMPGYHDLYMNYLLGSITWCEEEEVTGSPEDRECSYTIMPWNEVVLPPGF